VLTMNVSVFWDMMPRSLAESYQILGVIWFVRLQIRGVCHSVKEHCLENDQTCSLLGCDAVFWQSQTNALGVS